MSEKEGGPWKYPKVMRFIQMLRERPLLWDPNDPNYTNQYLRELAYDEISFEMGTTNDKIRQKCHTMRSQFLVECKKYKTRKNYQSTWNYFDALKDLFSHGRASEILSSEPQFKEGSERSNEHANNDSDLELTDPEYEDSLDMFMDDDIKVELKSEYNAKVSKKGQKNFRENYNKRSRTTTESSSYKLEQEQQHCEVDDVYDIFGRCVANELRLSFNDEIIYNTLKNKIIQAIAESHDELQKRDSEETNCAENL